MLLFVCYVLVCFCLMFVFVLVCGILSCLWGFGLAACWFAWVYGFDYLV